MLSKRFTKYENAKYLTDPFYAFLRDKYFTERSDWANRKDIEVLEKMYPHEIYSLDKGDLSKNIMGVGPKGESVIFHLIEEYKPIGMFCTCGEPKLYWYRFCPECGKEV